MKKGLERLASGGAGDSGGEDCRYVVRDCDSYYIADFDNLAEANASRAAQDFWDSKCKHQAKQECGDFDKTKRPIVICLGTSLISLFLGVGSCIVAIHKKKKKIT